VTEIIAAVVGAIVAAILVPLLAPLSWLGRVLQLRSGWRPKIRDLFDVGFVNEQGQNIYIRNPDPALSPNDLSWFRVTTHFKLGVKEPIVLTNIELYYPAIVSAWRGEQVIKINGDPQTTDGRFGLETPKVLAADTFDIYLVRTFRCNASDTWDGDFQELLIMIEFTTAGSSGFHRVLVTATLQPGGKVGNVKEEYATPSTVPEKLRPNKRP
jgi:hypothetical protein